ncbi:MAG TPA: hypothetical protein VIG24_11315 [Acidimicrobiia bacterium]
MAGLVDAGKNLLLEGLADGVTFVSLHTADPSTGGTSEVSGGAYTREAITWDTAASASVSTSASIVFDVPGSTTITHLGYWSASTAGTFYGSRALDTNQTFATAGTYTIATGNITESIT